MPYITGHPPEKVGWSSTELEYRTGYDVTMFCEVNIGSATLANSTEVEWSVPSSQNMPFQRQVSDDGNNINASLTLRNITEDDRGIYAVTFSNMCGSVSCRFSLKVDACSNRPDPVQKEVTINVSQNVSTLTLRANFSGTTDQTQWVVIWSNSSASNLGNFGSKYRTNRVVSDCFFTEELIIHNVSVSDAGLYFAKVYGSSDTGVNTTFHVNIMNRGDQKRKKAEESASVCSLLGSVTVVLPVVGGVSIGIYLKLRRKRNRRHSE